MQRKLKENILCLLWILLKFEHSSIINRNNIWPFFSRDEYPRKEKAGITKYEVRTAQYLRKEFWNWDNQNLSASERNAGDAFEWESSRLRNEMCRRTENFSAALNIKLDCISSMSTLQEALHDPAVIEYRSTYNRVRLL